MDLENERIFKRIINIMIYSMTGYAIINLQLPSTTIQIEIKSVNHRFFDLSFRAPDEFRHLEILIREVIMNKINRGKIDLKINIRANGISTTEICLDEQKLNVYMELYRMVKTSAPELKHSRVTDILNLPGIISSQSFEIDQHKDIIIHTIDQLCNDLKISQSTEGEKLANIILNKIIRIEAIVQQAIAALPQITQNYKAKLQQKLIDTLSDITVNEQRLQQEFAYFCQRIDVDEELSRLISHTKQFRRFINDGGIVGKRIDFLTQEMLREANTFGSKSVSTNTTEMAVELKVLIEQIKEQIQNIA